MDSEIKAKSKQKQKSGVNQKLSAFPSGIHEGSLDLEFKVKLKRKRKNGAKQNLSPFPTGIHEGIFTGLSVDVTQNDSILTIYKNGYYGKGSASRGAPKAEGEALVLQIEEAFFLAFFLKVLQITDLRGGQMDLQRMLEASLQINPKFIETFAAYLYLKSKNWVVKSGIKFGAEYVIYKDGPDVYHASFVVHVVQPNETELYKQKNFKSAQRVAESANKDVLFLEVTKPIGFVMTRTEDMSLITVSELIVRRLKMSAFIQCPNVNK